LDEGTARKKWLYVVLKRLYEERDQFPDPLGLVEEIYAAFDYPEEMEDFVRWMPAKQPVADERSGLARIEQNWRSYLERTATALQESGEGASQPEASS
jgi:hypothetical protein